MNWKRIVYQSVSLYNIIEGPKLTIRKKRIQRMSGCDKMYKNFIHPYKDGPPQNDKWHRNALFVNIYMTREKRVHSGWGFTQNTWSRLKRSSCFFSLHVTQVHRKVTLWHRAVRLPDRLLVSVMHQQAWKGKKRQRG